VRHNLYPSSCGLAKHDWAVFLSTDVNLEAAKVLEIYALRWAVEVYFKEAKQHLGFLKAKEE
jgi:IS4 transposase